MDSPKEEHNRRLCHQVQQLTEQVAQLRHEAARAAAVAAADRDHYEEDLGLLQTQLLELRTAPLPKASKVRAPEAAQDEQEEARCQQLEERCRTLERDLAEARHLLEMTCAEAAACQQSERADADQAVVALRAQLVAAETAEQRLEARLEDVVQDAARRERAAAAELQQLRDDADVAEAAACSSAAAAAAERRDLEAQLGAATELAAAAGGGQRGNSLFAELEDRRVRAEHLVQALREQLAADRTRHQEALCAALEAPAAAAARLEARLAAVGRREQPEVAAARQEAAELRAELAEARRALRQAEGRLQGELRSALEQEAVFGTGGAAARLAATWHEQERARWVREERAKEAELRSARDQRATAWSERAAAVRRADQLQLQMLRLECRLRQQVAAVVPDEDGKENEWTGGELSHGSFWEADVPPTPLPAAAKLPTSVHQQLRSVDVSSRLLCGVGTPPSRRPSHGSSFTDADASPRPSLPAVAKLPMSSVQQ